jgi:hypothetical protein
MSKTKPGIVLGAAHVTDPTRKTVFRNSGGFNHRGLGGDTVPGPGIGAPLVTSKRVDDFTATKSVFLHGNPHNRFSAPEVRGATMGVDDGRPPTHDSPARGPMPNRDITSKAGEVRANDPTAGVGVRPHGALDR